MLKKFKNIIIRDFHLSDVERMTFNDEYELRNIYIENINFFEYVAQLCQGNAFTYLYDNGGFESVVAFSFLHSPKKNVGEVNFFASKYLRNKFNSNLLRAFKYVLSYYCMQHPRIQAMCRIDPIYMRFLGFLGFHYEGCLKKFGLNGDDMLIYSIIDTPEISEE